MIISIQRDPKVHLAKIYGKDDPKCAMVFCKHYYLSSTNDHLAAEFKAHDISWGYEDVDIPFSGPLSFRQELRVWGTGVALVEVDRTDITHWIEKKLIEAYGENIKVQIKEVEYSINE